MKISSVGPSDAITNYISSTGAASAKSAPSAGIADSVELSEGAQKYSAVLKAAREAMEKAGVDEELKAAEITARIQDGSYQVSGDAVVRDILSGFPSSGR